MHDAMIIAGTLAGFALALFALPATAATPQGEAAHRLARIEFMDKHCGVRPDEADATQALSEAIRLNALDLKAYELHLLDKTAQTHGMARLCAALKAARGG